jgi:hypothetical protein
LTQVEQFIAYATDVTVCNANGTPQPNTTVEVSASSVVQIAANGSVYSVGPHAPVHLRTNRAGTIAIAQPTESLGAATLSFSLPLQEPIAVRQFAGVEHDLAVVSRDKLLDARDASGAFLLPDKYRNRDTAQALADNCHACMKLVRSTAVKLNAAELKGGARKLGVGAHSRDATERLNRIVAPSEPVHWLIEFGEGTMTYRELTEEAARNELRNFVGGPLALLSELGDLVTAVSNGIAQVTSALITAIDNEVRAAITFVIDGVNYIIRSAITLVEEVFDLVEVVFANVMVGFEKTFEWLGFVFNWDDILRTRSVIAYAIEEFLAFLPAAAAGIKTLVDGGIANLVAQIDPAFDGLVERLGNGNLGDCFRNNQQDDPVFSSGIANNQILDATLSSGSTASIRVPAAIMGAMSGPVDDVLKKIQDFTTSVGNINEFQRAREILQNLGGDLDQILNGIAAAMLRIVQGIIKFMLQGAQAVVDGLLDLLSTLTAALLLLLKAECDVPFVSAFYQWLAKAPLTPLDLVALIAAIPTTALYKAVTKAAPFPDQASVDLFKTSYTRQVLLARSGLGPSRDVVAVARDNPPSFTFQQFLDLANVTCTGTYGLLMTYPDTAAATDGTDGPASTAVKNASIIGFAAELGAQAFSFPWSSSTGPPDCVSSNGVKKWLWLHSVMGIVLDGLFLYHDGTFPENNNTAFGPVITFIWGLGRAGVYATGFTKLSIYSKISYGVEAAVPCLKIFRLPVLARPPVLAALALIDYVGYVTIATTTFLDSLPPTTEGSVAVSRVVPGAVPPQLGGCP